MLEKKNHTLVRIKWFRSPGPNLPFRSTKTSKEKRVIVHCGLSLQTNCFPPYSQLARSQEAGATFLLTSCHGVPVSERQRHHWGWQPGMLPCRCGVTTWLLITVTSQNHVLSPLPKAASPGSSHWLRPTRSSVQPCSKADKGIKQFA